MKNNPNPTRTELMRQKEALLAARRGHRLLKDKRDELMRQFLALAVEAKELRERAENQLSIANSAFLKARAELKKEVVASALSVAREKLVLLTEEKNVMNVKLPIYRLKKELNLKNLCNYGFAFTSSSLDKGVAAMGEAAELFISLAEKEKAIALLAAESERTRRRVNALEYVMIPEYTETIRKIKMTLDEQERANIIRLIKVKDMVLKQKTKN